MAGDELTVTTAGSPREDRGTRRRLLAEVEAGTVPEADLDAIVVPNGRSDLVHACAAARETDATLLLLCSHNGDAAKAVRAAREAGVRAFAIDTGHVPADVVPEFATTRLLAAQDLLHHPDTSFKRNLGLLVADLSGWARVAFLDDDIRLPRPADLREAAGLLDRYAAVGLANAGMPDNSVVYHAYRESGGQQDTFVGGGALVVGRRCFSSFFPDLYNEDWFFLLDDAGLRPTALIGSAHQSVYDPYEPGRAESEELGDTLAEGLYGLLDRGLRPADATEEYWAGFLESRREFIRTALRQVHAAARLDLARRPGMIESLRSALRRNEEKVTAALCTRFLQAWHTDRARWQAHVAKLREQHAGRDADEAFHTLGIDRLVRRS